MIKRQLLMETDSKTACEVLTHYLTMNMNRGARVWSKTPQEPCHVLINVFPTYIHKTVRNKEKTLHCKIYHFSVLFYRFEKRTKKRNFTVFLCIFLNTIKHCKITKKGWGKQGKFNYTIKTLFYKISFLLQYIFEMR